MFSEETLLAVLKLTEICALEEMKFCRSEKMVGGCSCIAEWISSLDAKILRVAILCPHASMLMSKTISFPS